MMIDNKQIQDANLMLQDIKCCTEAPQGQLELELQRQMRRPK